jgi:hypothetical protein
MGQLQFATRNPIDETIPMIKYNTLRLLSIAALAALSGCSSIVTFTSDIEGADVHTVDGVHYGKTPIDIRYDNDMLASSRNAHGCSQIPGVVYTWSSGAQARSEDPIVLCNDASHYTVSLNRPSEHPDLETDLRLALERQQARERILRQELELERMRNEMFFFGPGFGMRGAILFPMTDPRPAHPHPPRPPRH